MLRMVIWRVLLLSILGSLSLTGQSRIDSLEAELERAGTDPERIRLMNEISPMMREVDLGEALRYGEQALELARESGSDQSIADALNNVAYANGILGKFDAALESAYKALQTSRRRNYTTGIMRAQQALGLVYFKLNHYDRALAATGEALTLARDSGDELAEVRSLHNMAVIYEKIGDYERVLDHSEQALAIKERIGDEQDIAYSLGIMGVAYRELGELDKSLEYLQRALGMIREAGDRFGMVYGLMDIGRTYAEMGSHERAMDYLNRAMEHAKYLGARAEIAMIYESLASTSEKMGRYAEALKYHKAFKAQSDSIQTSTTFAELEAKHVAEQKQHDLDQQVLFRNFLLAGIALIGVIAALIFNLYRMKRNAVHTERVKNEELQQFNKALRREIAERQRVEEELRKSEMMLHLVMNNIPQAIFWKDSRMVFMGCNEAFARDAGFQSPAEIVGKTDYAVPLVREDIEVLREAERRVVESGEAELHVVYAVNRLDGETAWLETNKIPLFDDAGEVVGILGTYEDISERLEVEEALAKEREHLSVTLRSISDGVITTDIFGRIILLNQVAEELTGWTQEQALSRHLSDVLIIVSEPGRTTIHSPVDSVLNRSEVVEISNNVTLISRGGAERPVELSASPITDTENKIVGVVLAFRDVTARLREGDEQLKTQKLESVGILAGGIAHDFNNILTGVMANISFARTLPARQEDWMERLEEAERACLRAKDLTQQLLTFARGGAPIKRLTSISNLAESSVRFALRGSSVTCRMELEPALLPAEVDEGQLNQVLHNLVINAVQSMPAGGTIRVVGRNETVEENSTVPLDSGKYISLAIHDQGVGIPKKYLQKIFDPYFTTKQTGTGLGLATSYSIIRNHGGLITVDSEPGRGSIFKLWLPASARELKSVQRANFSPHKGTGRVLVMDDDASIVNITRRMLSELGYEVSGAASGDEALELYREAQAEEAPFDLVILDLTIPGGKGGCETMQELQKMDPGARAIVTSGYSTDPVMQNYTKYGFHGILTKPFNFEGLNDVLHNVIVNGNESGKSKGVS